MVRQSQEVEGDVVSLILLWSPPLGAPGHVADFRPETMDIVK